MINKIRSGAFWKKGSGEALGFITSVPMILVLICMFVSIIQVVVIKERLQYTAYCACRAAVIVDSKDMAETVALNVAKKDLAGSSIVTDANSVSVDITVEDGPEREDKSRHTLPGYNTVQTSNKWKKGNYCICEVTVVVDSFLDFLDGERSASMKMVIEKPSDFTSNRLG